MKNPPLQPTTKNPLKSAFLRDYRLLFASFLIVKNALNIF
ncbi:hypothetical protein L935_05795 [Helicobacter pylori PZ5086]|nr:hypothetical protein L935_05795 [Helicobacter pylori PZ5086]